jgi:hypothetical protein
MNIELDDEVPVPLFEDNLSRELARIHQHERAEPSSLDAPGGHGRGRRSVLTGVASIAAAIGLIAAILTIGSDENDGPDLEARIVAATETALSDSIVYEVTDFAHTPGPVDMESWSDEASLSVRTRGYGPDGEPASDVGQTEAPRWSRRANRSEARARSVSSTTATRSTTSSRPTRTRTTPWTRRCWYPSSMA